MSTEPKIPQILERDSVIILSGDMECHCGRLKDKAHCPACGRIRLYGMAETVLATSPSGDVVKGCHVYRCLGCAKKFNDVDWYYNCQAPIKIDWVATKEKQVQETRNRKIKEWMERIRMNHHFDYNDGQRCKAETGIALGDLREQVKHLTMLEQKAPLTLAEKIEIKKKQIKIQEQNLLEHPELKEDYEFALSLLKNQLLKLEEENER